MGLCAYFRLVIVASQVRKLESQGVPTKQAEAITSAITEVLNDSLESISESFVSKAEMQKVTPFFFWTVRLGYLLPRLVNGWFCFSMQAEMLQESNISKFKSQVQSSQVLSEANC